MIIRFLRCLLIVAILLSGCAKHHKSNTFKERYNIYAKPIPDYANPATPFTGAYPYMAISFDMCGLPIDTLEDFIDAIIRRMDAKTLEEYLTIQEDVETLYNKLRKYIDLEGSLYDFPEGHAYRYLTGMLFIRTESDLKGDFATIQLMKYEKTIKVR